MELQRLHLHTDLTITLLSGGIAAMVMAVFLSFLQCWWCFWWCCAAAGIIDAFTRILLFRCCCCGCRCCCCLLLALLLLLFVWLLLLLLLFFNSYASSRLQQRGAAYLLSWDCLALLLADVGFFCWRNMLLGLLTKETAQWANLSVDCNLKMSAYNFPRIQEFQKIPLAGLSGQSGPSSRQYV